MDQPPASRLRTWQRASAALGAALVLALGLFAAAPGWHASLHASHGHAGLPAAGDHGCAVDLFAGGMDLPVDLPSRLAAPQSLTVAWSLPAAECWVATPRYRLLPGRGPPLA